MDLFDDFAEKYESAFSANDLGPPKRAVLRTADIIPARNHADLITVDLRKAHLTPVIDIIGALVYSANGSDVSDVIIDGRVIMKDRKILTVDEEEIIVKTQEAARNCLKRAGMADVQTSVR